MTRLSFDPRKLINRKTVKLQYTISGVLVGEDTVRITVTDNFSRRDVASKDYKLASMCHIFFDNGEVHMR